MFYVLKYVFIFSNLYSNEKNIEMFCAHVSKNHEHAHWVEALQIQ